MTHGGCVFAGLTKERSMLKLLITTEMEIP